MLKLRIGPFAAAVVVMVAVLGVPGVAQAAPCPSFPRVVWWGPLTHESAIKDVNRRYGGNWKTAIDSWQYNLAKLMAIQKKGSTAAIRYTSKVNGHPVRTSRVKLRGERLDDYIDNVWKRLAVMHCLADL